MKEFDHQNVMNLLGVCLDAGSAPYMVLPYMENGSLLSFLKNNRNTLLLDGGTSHDEVSHTHSFTQHHQLTLHSLYPGISGASKVTVNVPSNS